MTKHNGPAHRGPKQCSWDKMKTDSRPVQSTTSIYLIFLLLKFPNLITPVDFLPAEGTKGVSFGLKRRPNSKVNSRHLKLNKKLFFPPFLWQPEQHLH